MKNKIQFWSFLLLPLIGALFAHQMSYTGIWISLWSPVFGASEPPIWSLWLGDGRTHMVLIIGLIGSLVGLVTKWPIVGGVFVGASAFVGVLALPVAWAVLVGEQAGVALRRRLMKSFFIFLGMMLMIAVLGDETRGVIRAMFPGEFFNPNAQLVMCLAVPLLIIAIERYWTRR